MLKSAELLIERVERLDAENSAKNLRVLAETEYKAAIEYLQEMVGKNINAKQWLDRDTYWAFVYIQNPQVPRLVSIRSIHKPTECASAKISKEDIKRTVLQNASVKIIDAENTEEALAKSAKLKALMAKLQIDSNLVEACTYTF